MCDENRLQFCDKERPYCATGEGTVYLFKTGRTETFQGA